MLYTSKNRALNCSKRLFSLMAALLLVFNMSGKGFIGDTQPGKGKPFSFVHKVSVETKVYQINSIPDEIQEDLSEIELDDFEFLTFENFSIQGPALDMEETELSVVHQFHRITKLPLYALFCKWKFHLI